MGTANVDEAFLSAGQTPGIEIWRIEKLKVVPQTKLTHGEFYSGDSYILLKTNENPNSGKLEWDVHFWLGNETSQDEKGVAAYKTVELDDYLRGAPVQHREVQDHESKLFLSYFKNGIKYLSGGVESGFTKVERDVYEKRLFHIKGKKNVRVRQIKCHCSSLNKGDVFLLDCGLTLHLWNGPTSSHFERLKGSEIAKRIRDEERSGKAEIRIIDKLWDIDTKFYSDLGSQCEIEEGSAGGDDIAYEKSAQGQETLYRVSDSTGTLEVTEVAQKPFSQSDLDSSDCFILDAGSNGMFVWIGKHCTGNEKKSAWKHATDFLTLKGYPEWTKVTRLADGGETPMFKEYFRSWHDRDDQKGLGNIYTKETIAKIDPTTEQIDFKELQRRKNTCIDDDTQEDTEYKDEIVKKWLVLTTTLTPVEPDEVGMFCSSSCYVILHSYRDHMRQNHVVYYWQGLRSSSELKGASAISAQRIDETETTGSAVQVRVLEGKEPPMFLKIFRGRMIIYMNHDTEMSDSDQKRLFHIRGKGNVNVRTIEVEPSSSSLNSQDTFLLIHGDTTFIWTGKFSNQEEQALSQEVSEYIAPNNVKMCINEGEETEEFWESLGGKSEYAEFFPRENLELIPGRLFLCSNTTGRFKVEEALDFTQEDLSEDDVMLLDTYQEIFVWIGRGANLQERKASLEAALAYLEADETGRDENNTILLQVKQGHEPASFFTQFPGWDNDRFRGGIQERDGPVLGEEESLRKTVQEELTKYYGTYHYEELVARLPPVGVDPACKEEYLSDAEFREIFGLERLEYRKKPRWRQIEMKKQAGLF